MSGALLISAEKGNSLSNEVLVPSCGSNRMPCWFVISRSGVRVSSMALLISQRDSNCQSPRFNVNQLGSTFGKILFTAQRSLENNLTCIATSLLLGSGGLLLDDPHDRPAHMKSNERSGSYYPEPIPSSTRTGRAALPNNFHATSGPSGRERGAAKEARRMDASSVSFKGAFHD